jgi:hypothetical protein
MYNTAKSTLFISPIMTFTSTPRSHINRLGAAAQPTLVWLAVGPAPHISSERAEKKHSTVSTCAGPQGCGQVNYH